MEIVSDNLQFLLQPLLWGFHILAPDMVKGEWWFISYYRFGTTINFTMFCHVT